MADQKPAPKDSRGFDLKKDGSLLALIAVCLYLLLALVTYSPADAGWASTNTEKGFANAGGPVGAYIADALLHALGILAYVAPLMAGARIIQLLRQKEHDTGSYVWLLRLAGFVVSLLALAPLLELSVLEVPGLPAGAGGIAGQGIALLISTGFGVYGAGLLLTLALCLGLMLFFGFSWLAVFDAIGHQTLKLLAGIKKRISNVLERINNRREQQSSKSRTGKTKAVPAVEGKKEPVINMPAAAPAKSPMPVEPESTLADKVRKKAEASINKVAEKIAPKEVKIEPLEKLETKTSDRAIRDLQGSLFADGNPLPSIALLDQDDGNQKPGYSKERLEELSVMLEQKLGDFGIKAEVVAVAPGPVITRFEIQPAPGTKASKVSNIAQDLARSMAMSSVRVVEVIPGKSVMGIEIPNENRAMVRLASVLSADQFDKSKSPLTLAIGHDIGGNPVITDLAKMPHLLVAGTTGSGKSVGVNAMILSLLYKSTPDEVRLIMVDPKMLELSIYEGIPHLLTPVITDMKEAANGLRWSVEEMERRYQLMAAMGVRNIAGYNKKIRDAIEEGKPIPDPLWQIDQSFDTTPPLLEPLPYIVVVVDEFADMMMTVGKKVEELIARIAQKARAAGIHLILATQRPSVDVITGLIKANVPTRIAFQVSSKIDSRTIIDQGGAEQLLGHGDMLYQPAGTGLPIRVHGAFVDDDEVHRVVAEWKSKGEPQYIEEITKTTEPGSGPSMEGGDEKDDLYDQAVAFVTETGKVSISSVQRKLRIGYNRAARLVETMEETGVVSPPGHNGSREVLAAAPSEF